MNVERVLEQYLSEGCVVAPQVAAVIEQPHARQQLYKALLGRSLVPFHNLLRHLLEEEARFRRALWERDAEDEEDHYEGIYRCAFLLSCCADPSDTLLLWKAKHLNMDVGCSMGVEYFVGAGANETLRFLERSDAEDSVEVAAYVRGWFSQPDAAQWRQDWEEERAEDIRSA